MADQGDNGGGGTTGGASRPGRPAKRRVDPAVVGGGSGGSPATGRVAPSPNVRPKPGPRKPWQRGIFWFGVIVAVTLASVGLTYAIDRKPDVVELGDLRPEFCDRIRELRGITVDPTLTVDVAAQLFEDQHEKYLDIVLVAPADLQADIVAMQEATLRLEAVAERIVERKGAEPGYEQALVDLIAQTDELGTEYAIHAERVAYAARVGCNVDFDAPGTTVPRNQVPIPTGIPGPGVPPGGTVPPDPTSSVPVPGESTTTTIETFGPFSPTTAGPPLR